jgi:hypothetical protein
LVTVQQKPRELNQATRHVAYGSFSTIKQPGILDQFETSETSNGLHKPARAGPG